MSGMLTREITEVTYLNARSNTARYRYIMRFFYDQYQRMNYWLQPEAILQGVLSYGLEEEYNEEKLQADLNQLVMWKSLTEQHDGGRVTSIEDYLKKRFRYMMTPYAIEIERLIIQLEGVNGYGGSLQPSKLHELVELVRKVRFWPTDRTYQEADEVWDKLLTIYKELNEQAADFIASLSSQKTLDLFTAEAFLQFKDQLIAYLQDFIQVLQYTAPQIAHWLETSQSDKLSAARFLEQVVSAKMFVPQLEEMITREEWESRINSQWENFVCWFVGDEEASNVARLEQMTKETIFRVLRAAVRIQERGRHGNSRSQELEMIGRWFIKVQDNLDEAHRLAAYAFGLYETRHYYGEHDDRISLHETSMWNTEPYEVRLLPRGHQSKQRNSSLQPIVTRKNKVASIQEHLDRKQREDDFLERFVERGMVSISELEEVGADERQQILIWITRCTDNMDLRWTTPEGVLIQLAGVPRKARAVLRCEDGDLEMPDFTLVFRREHQS